MNYTQEPIGYEALSFGVNVAIPSRKFQNLFIIREPAPWPSEKDVRSETLLYTWALSLCMPMKNRPYSFGRVC